MTILEKIKFEEDWLSEVNLTKENIKIAFAGIRATVLEQQPCEDCISREETIKWLKKVTVTDGITFKTGFEQILYDIEQMPSVTPKAEWIPVSERLPKAGEYVGDVAKYYLVQNEYGDMLVARHTHSEYWEQIYQLQPIGDEIVAWMPLPQPYKAESEEEE